MLLKDLKAKYLDQLKNKHNPKTVKQYEQRLNRFFSFFNYQKISSISDLTSGVINKYEETLSQISTNARYVYLEQAKRFLQYLYENNYSFLNLSDAISLPKWERKKKKQLTAEEKEAIITAVKEKEPFLSRNKAILALKLYENLKTSEIAGLTIIDIAGKEIRLTRRKRFQQLQPETEKYLKQYYKVRQRFHPKEDYLFIKYPGIRLDSQTITKVLKVI